VPEQGGGGAPGDRHGVDAARAVRRRQRLLSVLGVLVGAGLVVLAAGRPWVTQRVIMVPGVVTVSASGDQAAPGAVALAAVAAAGAVALLVAGRLAARLAGLLVTLAGAGVAASVVSVLADPRGAAATAVPGATGRTGPLGEPASPSAWVMVALAGGLLVVAGGVVAAARAGAWPVPGRRFEQASGGGTDGGRADPDDGTAAGDPVTSWDALSRGDDPTA
jgi:uncharacterized membrane protein (TIGR02234 family)